MLLIIRFLISIEIKAVKSSTNEVLLFSDVFDNAKNNEASRRAA